MKTQPAAGSILKAFGTAASVGLLLAVQPVHAVPLSALPDVSLLTPYATFGNSFDDSNVTVVGNAGISENGDLRLMAPSTITGNVYLAPGATVSPNAGAIGGSIINVASFVAAQAEVFSASTTLQGLAPNTTLGNVNAGAGLILGATNGSVDAQVYDLTSLTSGGGNISFVGDFGDYFVLNIAQGLSLTGSAAIGSLAQASHTFINLYDNSGADLGVVAHVGNQLFGTTLVPYDDVTFHSISGAIWGGTNEIVLMSDSTVTNVPFQSPAGSDTPGVPDSGSSWVLFSLGLGILAFGRRKQSRSQSSIPF